MYDVDHAIACAWRAIGNYAEYRHCWRGGLLVGVSFRGYNTPQRVSYPGIVQDFQHTFAVLRGLPCDVFLGAHGGYFDMLTKLKHYPQDGSRVFVDAAGYRNFVANAQQTFEQELRKQKGDAAR